MRLLVTGGTGYIGSHTCVELLDAGHDVVIIDNLSNSKKSILKRIHQITGKSCTFYEADLRDTDNLKHIFEKNHIDAVMHFASLKSVGASVKEPLLYYNNNVTGALCLVEAMQHAEIKHLVFSSSATVYGAPDHVPIKETAELKPATNPYGACKQMIERILLDLLLADPAWNISILRYFNPAGAHHSGLIGEDPRNIPDNLLPYIAQVAVNRLPCLKIYGNDYPTHDGTGVRDYIHVVDLALGHIAALKVHENDQGAHIYNLGTGRGVSVMEALSAFNKVCKKELPYEIAGRRSGDIATCYADPTLANQKMNWKAKYTFEAMLKDIWRWQSHNPTGLPDA